jgi:hypothetical protein
MNRQKTILIALVGVLILAIFYAYFQYPRQSRFSGVTKAESPVSRQAVRRKARAGEGGGDQFRIRFDWLKNGKPFTGAQQDLFGPLFVDKKPMPLVSTKKTSSLPMMPKSEEATKIHTSPLEFLGSLTSGQKKTYFFSQGEDLFVAKKGKKFGKQKEFSIAGVTSKEIKIKKQGEAEILTISLVAKAPLSGFNKQRPQKVFLPQNKISLPKVSEEMNAVPMEQQAPDEPPSDEGKEPPPAGDIIPEGEWEK